jgi:hypothetical protein
MRGPRPPGRPAAVARPSLGILVAFALLLAALPGPGTPWR